MTRTIIRLEEWGDDSGQVRVNFRPEEPSNVPDRMRWRTLNCHSGQAPFADLAAVAPGEKNPLNGELVRLVGETIHAALSQHPGVAQALDRAAGSTPGEVHPIHLLTSAMDAEVVPWETLHHPVARFLGLDPRFSISRAVSTGGGVVERAHAPPLRIAAILAAADRDARGEWAALRDAITASGIETSVTLFVAHDELEAEVVAAAHPWVQVRRVPATKEELLAVLVGLRPQILHVYSHGSARGGFLEVATPGSVGFGDPPLYLEARHLAALRNDLWLVTLDACEGASPAEGVHSIAYTLVESGVPAAIGMREVIDSSDANVFSRAFYASALSELARSLLPGTRVTVDWAGHLARAREALCARIAGPAGMTAGSQKPWTLPVLYRRADDLLVRTPSENPGLDDAQREHLLGELQMLRLALATLHPDNPDSVRQALQARIAEFEALLRG